MDSYFLAVGIEFSWKINSFSVAKCWWKVSSGFRLMFMWRKLEFVQGILIILVYSKGLFATAIILVAAYDVTGQHFTPSTEVDACFGRPDGFAQDVNNCQNYFICVNGHATRSRCPAGLLFDAANEVCWWRSEVTCFECPRTAVYTMLSAPRTCNHFYRCWQGRATIHTCPNGLIFHPERRQCTFLEGSGCEGDTAVQQGCPARDGAEPVFLSDAFNCSAYHVCLNGEPVRQECADGLHFNPFLRVCDTPEQANCQVQQQVGVKLASSVKTETLNQSSIPPNLIIADTRPRWRQLESCWSTRSVCFALSR